MSEIKIVVAGLIFDKDKFLVARRPITKSRGGLFEFVGGKVEEGETHAEALRREFMEELNLEIKVGELFMKVRHTSLSNSRILVLILLFQKSDPSPGYVRFLAVL